MMAGTFFRHQKSGMADISNYYAGPAVPPLPSNLPIPSFSSTTSSPQSSAAAPQAQTREMWLAEKQYYVTQLGNAIEEYEKMRINGTMTQAQYDEYKNFCYWHQKSVSELQQSYLLLQQQPQQPAIVQMPTQVVVYGPGTPQSTPSSIMTAQVPIMTLPIPKPQRKRSPTPPMPVRPTQEWTLVDVATRCVPPTWEQLFAESLPDIRHISSMIDNPQLRMEYPYYPRKEDIFRAFWKTPLDKVKVVLFGQDPYHSFSARIGLPTATGMAFSSRPNDVTAKSVNNMFKELANTVPGFRIPTSGDLSLWAEEGVFLLNSCLHVQPGKAMDSKKMDKTWWGFIKRTLTKIQERNGKVIFILLGGPAQEMKQFIYKHSSIVSAAHPSPLSAHLFFGSDVFNKANQKLKESGQEPVNWCLE